MKKIYGYVGDISSVFLEKGIELLADNGCLSFIITSAITYSEEFWEVRNRIYENFEEAYVSTFDRDKCRFFEGMTQSVSIIMIKNKRINSSCKFYTSIMFRETPAFNKIEYELANDYLLTGAGAGGHFSEKHRLPKIGRPIIKEILGKIVTNRNKLSDYIKKWTPMMFLDYG